VISLDKTTYKKIQGLMPIEMSITEQINMLINERLEQLENCEREGDK
jgi:hypothetical protein